ncbi:DnaD domain protein [Caldicellulosiruptoraceae bacterium PP1]
MAKIFLSKEHVDYVVISHNFIANQMPFANGEFVKVFIYLKYLLSTSANDIDISKIAKDLNLLESDILKAIDFWAEKNQISIEKDQDGNISVLFSESVKENITEKQEVTPPVYSTEDIERFYETDNNFKFLVSYAENQYCKRFNKNDIDILLEIYDWLKLPIPVIVVLINYLTINRNNKSLKYLEQVAISWKEMNINTAEKAEEYIKSQEDKSKVKKLVLQNLGIYNRMPTKVENEMMDKWINEWKFSPEVILYACNYTKNINNPTVNYINGILKKWYEEGLKDIDTIQNYEKETKKEKSKNVKSNNSKSSQQRDPSEYAELEDLFKKVVRGNGK